MSEHREVPIPEDLKARYKRLGEYKPIEVAVCDIYVREYQSLIERIGHAENAVAERDKRIAELTKRYNALMVMYNETQAQRDSLLAQGQRLSASVSDACKKAAVEICNTYDVSAPRGKSFANRPPVTISIIIEQALIAASKEPSHAS